jgi:hypothetical protein
MKSFLKFDSFPQNFTHEGCKEGICHFLTLLNAERYSRLLNNLGLIFLTLTDVHLLIFFTVSAVKEREYLVSRVWKIFG